MKRVFTAFALLITVALVPQTAQAVDFTGQATVSIVDGIVITETAPLNFGSLVKDDGTVVLNADGTVTDAADLIFDNTGQQPAAFSVTSVAGQGITVSAAIVAEPAGVTVDTWTMDWNGAGSGDLVGDHTMQNDTDTMTLGASIAIDKATVTIGDAQAIDYTLTMVFN